MIYINSSFLIMLVVIFSFNVFGVKSSNSSASSTSTSVTEAEKHNDFDVVTEDILLEIFSCLSFDDLINVKKTDKKFNRVCKDQNLIINVPAALIAKIEKQPESVKVYFTTFFSKPHKFQTIENGFKALLPQNAQFLEKLNLCAELFKIDDQDKAMLIAAQASFFFHPNVAEKSKVDHWCRYLKEVTLGALQVLSCAQIEALVEGQLFGEKDQNRDEDDPMQPLFRLSDRSSCPSIIYSYSVISGEQIRALLSGSCYRQFLRRYSTSRFYPNFEQLVLAIVTWSPGKIDAFHQTIKQLQGIREEDYIKIALCFSEKKEEEIIEFNEILRKYIEKLNEKIPPRSWPSLINEFTSIPTEQLSKYLEDCETLLAYGFDRKFHAELRVLVSKIVVAFATNAERQAFVDSVKSSELKYLKFSYNSYWVVSEVVDVFCALAEAKKTPAEVNDFVTIALSCIEALPANLVQHVGKEKIIKSLVDANVSPKSMERRVKTIAKHAGFFFSEPREYNKENYQKLLSQLLKLKSKQTESIVASEVFGPYKDKSYLVELVRLVFEGGISENVLKKNLDIVMALKKFSKQPLSDSEIGRLMKKTTPDLIRLYENITGEDVRFHSELFELEDEILCADLLPVYKDKKLFNRNFELNWLLSIWFSMNQAGFNELNEYSNFINENMMKLGHLYRHGEYGVWLHHLISDLTLIPHEHILDWINKGSALFVSDVDGYRSYLKLQARAWKMRNHLEDIEDNE